MKNPSAADRGLWRGIWRCRHPFLSTRTRLRPAEHATHSDVQPVTGLLPKSRAIDPLRFPSCPGTRPWRNWPIVDATGLKGSWDFTLGYECPAAANGCVTVFDALEKQLGLKLELQKRPMPALVIDHVERKPADL